VKVLIVKTSALGDIIQAFPTLQFIKRYYPQARVNWIVEQSFAELVRTHPFVDSVLEVNTKKWRKSLWKAEVRQEIRAFCRELQRQHYDVVFDLQGNVKSGLMTGLAKAEAKVGFGYQTLPEWPNFLFTNRRYNPPSGQNIREDYLFLVQSFFGHFQADIEGIKLKMSISEQLKIDHILCHSLLRNEMKVMVCPGSNWSNKQVSENSLKEFLARIKERLNAKFLFVWGSQAEKHQAEKLHEAFFDSSLIVDKMALSALQNLMNDMDLVIAMDSLPLHLAGTTSTPTYSIFGASLEKKYKPLGSQHYAFQGTCPYKKRFDKRCPILRSCSTGLCIKAISGYAMFEHFIEWWNKRNKKRREIKYDPI
jgi:heptosyltransferase I